jgi:transcriptional regulator with XRE-family HTH domain
LIVDRLQSTRILVGFVRNEKKLRQRAGLNQQEAAFLAGLHHTAISLLERHERMPRLETIVRIFSVVESDPWELLDGLAWTLDHQERRRRPEAERRSAGVDRRLVVPGPAMRFGLLLTRKRLLARLRQEEVGLMLQTHRTEISVIERGRRQPLLDGLLQLAAAVDSDPGDLLSGMRWIPGDSVAGGRYLAKRAEADRGSVSCV